MVFPVRTNQHRRAKSRRGGDWGCDGMDTRQRLAPSRSRSGRCCQHAEDDLADHCGC